MLAENYNWIRDTGYGIRDTGYGIRDTGYGIRFRLWVVGFLHWKPATSSWHDCSIFGRNCQWAYRCILRESGYGITSLPRPAGRCGVEPRMGGSVRPAQRGWSEGGLPPPSKSISVRCILRQYCFGSAAFRPPACQNAGITPPSKWVSMNSLTLGLRSASRRAWIRGSSSLPR